MKRLIVVLLAVGLVAHGEVLEDAEHVDIPVEDTPAAVAEEADPRLLDVEDIVAPERLPPLPVPDPRFRIGMELGWTTGKSSWEISFLDFAPGLGFLDGRSRLEWDDLDSIMYRLHGEYKVADLLRLSASVGLGSIRNGNNTDTDWFVNLLDRDYVFSESVADTDGDVTMFDVNAYVRLNELVNFSRLGGVWDLFIGYQYHEEDLRDQNGVQTIDFEDRVRIPFPGLDSTYTFEWQAVRLGVRTEVPLAQRFRMRGSLAGLWTRFEGEGFWNLRDDFRDESPNFVQSASNGLGIEFRWYGTFDITENFFAEFGWWGLYMEARNGSDEIYFVDGDIGRTDLDYVKTQRHGFFIGVGGQF